MRFLLSGYYGFGNLGDEALARIIVGELKRRHPGATIDVLSATPRMTAEQLEVEATPRASIAALREAVGRADVVISGGGGLLQNSTSTRSLLYYAGVLQAAARARRKSMILAQSIGPLDFVGKMIVRRWCKGVSRATVRDARSARLLASLLPSTPVEQTADPVFLFGEPDPAAAQEFDALKTDGNPLVVVCVRKSPGLNDGTAVVARAIDTFSREYGAHVALLPLGGAQDAEVSTMVIRKCKSSPTLVPVSDLGRAAAMISRAHAVIGMRLHAVIFAIRFGVPFLAIPYDPKVSSLCDDIHYPLPPLWIPGTKERPEEAQTDALVARLMSEHDVLAAHLRAEAARLRLLAERNFEVLDQLAGE